MDGRVDDDKEGGHLMEENYKELFWLTLRLMTSTARKRIEMTTVEVQQRTPR